MKRIVGRLLAGLGLALVALLVVLKIFFGRGAGVGVLRIEDEAQ